MSLCKGVFFWALILSLVAPVFAEEVIITKINKNIYSRGESILASGIVYSGSFTASGSGVNLAVYNSSNSSISTNTTTTDSEGKFSALVVAPENDGTYSLNISSGNATVTYAFEVSAVSSVQVELVDPTLGADAIELVTLGLSSAGVGITDIDPKINSTDARYGNFSHGGSDYYVVVETDVATGKHKTVFLDDDSNLSFSNTDNPSSRPMYKYLEKGSKLKLGSDHQFEIIYVDPLGSEVIIASKSPLKFNGSGSETYTVLAIALNSSDAPVSGAALVMRLYDDKGVLLNSSAMVSTGANGTSVLANNQVGTSGGVFNVVVNDLGRISYTVETFLFTVSLTTVEGESVYAVAPGTNLTFTASVLNATTQKPIEENFLMNITIVGPGCSPCLDNRTLYNGTRTEYVDAPVEGGTYNIEFAVGYRGVTVKRVVKFIVRNYDLFAFPIAKEKGPSQGFAPGENGSILVGISEMSTGDLLNLTDLTGNCANVTFEGIFDSNGNSVSSTVHNKTNLTEFFASQVGIPDEIKEHLKEDFGEGACVFLFSAPTETGVYNAKINATVNGSMERAVATVGVQDIFVSAYPASKTDGAFTYAFSPGSDVYMVINAYDPVSGVSIQVSDILDASLVEVYAENGGVVTEKMLNESFVNTSQLAMLHFVANDSVMGNHFVKFRIKANVTRSGAEKTVEALGDGWFQTKLYQVWAYPTSIQGQMRWVFGHNSDINMTIEVRDSAGTNGQQGVTVTLDEVRNAMTWEKVSNVNATDPTFTNATRTSCTTNSNGTCVLQINHPPSGWDSGGHNARFKITATVDGTEVIDYGYGWFDVRSFNFWAWTQNWEVATGKEANITVQTSTFDWQPLAANVTIDKVMYMGTFENWRPPTVVNDSVGVSIMTDPSKWDNIITLPGGTIAKEGMYSVLLKAFNDTYGTESAQAWFYARPFTLWAGIENLTEWPPRFGLEGANMKVKGFDTMVWSWPEPTGGGHILNASWVASVEKMGQWGVKFKTQEQMFNENNVSSSCTGSVCNLTFNMSGFTQGEYQAIIAANDSTGAKATTWFWFRVEQLRIGLPQLMDWLTVYDNKIAKNSTYFNVSDNCPAGGKPSSVADTNCAYVAKAILQLVRSSVNDGGTPYSVTYFLFDKNSSAPRLYVNNSVPEGATANFTNAPNYITGQNFTDASGNRWIITNLDSSQGYVYLEALDGVIGSDWMDQSFLFIVDQSLSKSGKFIQAGDNFFEQEWLKIDLNGDGDYFDQYFLLLADSQSAGKYDTALMSATTNITNGTSSKDAGGMKLSPSAKPIHLLNIRYRAGSGGAANEYRPVFTSNELSWWSGMPLGTFKSGSVIKVPVIVASPSNKSLLKNATVNITALISMGGFKMETIPVAGVSENTNTSGAPGVAIIKLNTSKVEKDSGKSLSGRYRLEIQALDLTTPGSDWVTMPNVWEYPEIEIRNFEVSGQMGKFGQITGIQEWSANRGNLVTKFASQLVGGFAEAMDCNKLSGQGFTCGPSNPAEIFGFWMGPYGDQVYYNATNDNDTILVDEDRDWNLANAIAYDYKTQLIPVKKDYNTTEFMNVTIIKDNLDKTQNTVTVVNVGGSKEDTFYNFTIYNVSTTPGAEKVNLSVEKLDPWGKWTIYDSTWPWLVEGSVNLTNLVPGTFFNVTNITGTQVTLRWDGWFIVMNSGLDIDGVDKRARLVNASDYELIIYNSKQRNTSQDLSPWDMWRQTADTVRVINGSNGSMIAEYPFGQPITEIGGKAVVGGGEKWNEKVYLSSLTINNKVIYPLPWSCDVPVYYVGNFTEKSAKADMDYDNQYNNATQYYLILFDSLCDGVSRPTAGISDDDAVLDSNWVWDGITSFPWDFDHAEEGKPQIWNPSYNFSEQWTEIGSWGTPQITEFNPGDGSNGAAISFSQKWSVTRNETFTVWIKAKDFEGVGINGNATVSKIVLQSWGEFGPVETDVTPSPAPNTTVVNGTGYLGIDTSILGSGSTMGGGQYIAKILVTSTDGSKEILEVFFWIDEGFKF